MNVGRLIELLLSMDEYADVKIACSGVCIKSDLDSGGDIAEMDIASVYCDDRGAVWIDGEP